MIDGLKPFPEYKDSDLPWLGRIPAHWGEQLGFAVFREKQEKNTGMRENRVLSLSYGQIVIKPVEKLHGLVPDSFETYQIVDPGDLIIRSTDLQNDWTSLRVGLVRDRGIITSAYLCLKNLGSFTPAFAFLMLHSYDLQKFFYGLGSGLRQNLGFGDFKRLPFPVPPNDEQTAIVRFLDYAGGRIDGAIRAKKELIALLNEQKQAIIHRAVTRGLDPNVPLKSSGIPWVGDIPRHWQTPLMGRCLIRIEQGWSPVAAEGEIETNQWAVLTLSSVRRGVFNSSAIKPISRGAAIPTDIQVRDGDILLTRSNTRDRVGDVCIVRGVRQRTLLCDLIYRLTLRNGAFVPQFLIYQLLCPIGRGQIERDARGSSGTMPKLSQGHIKSWRVLVPPITEQEEIVAHVNKRCAPLETTIERASREIALLHEYRTRLTADVVTGKLDVHESARKLPDTAEEAGATLEIEELTDVEAEDVEA